MRGLGALCGERGFDLAAEIKPLPPLAFSGISAALCIFCPRMTRETVLDPRQEILRVAARLFQQQGYDATSMNDVAAALKLSKGGLYHHFQSKDEILFDLMNHALDITQERVSILCVAFSIPRNACAN